MCSLLKYRCGNTWSGEVGFITASVKTVADCKVGDTITEYRNPTSKMLPGFKPSTPVVHGLFQL